RSKLLPFGGDLPEAALADLGRRTREAVDRAAGLGEITMSVAAKGLWGSGYRRSETETAETGLIGHPIARWAPQKLRLALIYALLDGSATIEPAHLKAAFAVWNYCEASARTIFDNLSTDRVADTILAELMGRRPGGMTRGDFIHEIF